jgi:hypothetical protein
MKNIFKPKLGEPNTAYLSAANGILPMPPK